MRLFVQLLEGNVRIRFRNLQANYIPSWEALTNIFINQWVIKKYLVHYLTEFEEKKRNTNELVLDFIKSFNEIYNKMPAYCKPPVTAAKVRFSKAFEDDFSLMLRERKSRNLADIQIDAFEVEACQHSSLLSHESIP